MGVFKRRPSGWIAGQARPRWHRTYAPGHEHGDDGESVIGPSDLFLLLDAEWEVQIPGAGPYVVRDVGRRGPMWLDESLPVGGRGKRFWSVRLRRTGGLLAEVGVPCLVDPADRDHLWLDWDAAYDLHVPAWDRAQAVDHAIEQRRGGIDAAIGKVLSPLRPKLDPADQHLVDAAIAADVARSPEGQAQAPLLHRALNPLPDGVAAHADERSEVEAQVRATAHVHQVGREVPATIVAIAATGRTVCGTPEYELHVDIDDETGVRRVVHREVMGDAFAGRMAVGTRTLVCVDRADAQRIALEQPQPLASRMAAGQPALAEYGRRHERITLHGRRADAVIVSAAATGGQMCGLPEWAIHLDVTDGGAVRRVVHHEPLARARSPWTPGLRTAVRIDPDDPEQVTFA
jgi:hypothetical protein